MAENISRNDPCPCGSGEKYKKCCMGKRAPIRGRRLLWMLLAGGAVLALTVVVSLTVNLRSGLGAGAAGLLAAAVVFAVTGAPPSGRGQGGASDINFGR